MLPALNHPGCALHADLGKLSAEHRHEVIGRLRVARLIAVEDVKKAVVRKAMAERKTPKKTSKIKEIKAALVKLGFQPHVLDLMKDSQIIQLATNVAKRQG